MATPSELGSPGLSGKASNTGRPTRSARALIVTVRYASLASTMTRSGSSTTNAVGALRNNAR